MNLFTVRMTDTEHTLQADRATWEALIAALGRHSREALAIQAAVERSANPRAVRVTVGRGVAARLIELAGRR